MGSYGLGLSRILAASTEVLSKETEMKWPDVLAPYNVIILPPKVSIFEIYIIHILWINNYIWKRYILKKNLKSISDIGFSEISYNILNFHN